jgi:TolB-like protein
MIFRKLAVVLLALTVAGMAFAKDNLAVLPFTGGTEEEGETIAELFSFSQELNTVFAPIPRTSITQAIKKEQNFQYNTGMTNPDTIMAIGKQLGAKYVIAGNIGKLGNQNLLIISILKIDDLRQVAGDIQTYVDEKEIQGKLPDMARNIIEATKIDASHLDKLAVIPVDLGKDTEEHVADTLAQILSVNLIRSRKYAVYPRTKTLEQVQAEYDTQKSGITADENIVDQGMGDNPRFVLSVVERRLADQTMFNAVIIDFESGVQVVGRTVNYQSLDDGIRVMESLAQELTKVSISYIVPSDLSLAQSLAWLNSNAKEGESYIITLKNNETIAPRTLSYGGKKVGVTLNGGAVEWTVSLGSNGALFTVGNGITLTLGNNISLQGRNNNTSSLVYVNSGGTLVMESGSKISRNSNTADNSSGGGVIVSSNGTFILNDGEISGNTASYGAGVFVRGTFTMSGGAIKSNKTGASGSGVYVSANGTFTMSGGEINGNTASYGAGVFVDNSTFTMDGGTIKGNTANNNGGGVRIFSNGTFTMNDGEISGNTAPYGGGMYVESGTFTLSDGAINGNTASFGGGAYIDNNGKFTLIGGIISDNSATGSSGNGGGVLVWGTFTMGDGVISGNTAKNGGGVYVSTNGTFTLSGGEINGNTASNSGGGVHVSGGTFTKQAGGIIYGSNANGTLKNTATSGNDYGHAVYVNSSPIKKRNSTASSGVKLDSTISGSSDGWE